MKNNIDFEITPIDEATDAIIEFIKDHFFNGTNTIDIETEISGFLTEHLKKELYCLIEFPYVDKVFRDSYYCYYSSKHSEYERDCIRVSLFSYPIEQNEFFDVSLQKSLKEKYLGFFIIRPLKLAPLGRAHINPKALINDGFRICKYKANSMILGLKFETWGFPFSSQDGETISCAETTIWGLMEYFGTKYPEYKPTLPSKIINTLKSVSFQRQLPSKGLSMEQISFALKEFGFGTRIYSYASFGKSLYNIIDYYIESGIPIALGFESPESGHAVIAIGKQQNSSFNWDVVKKDSFGFENEEITYIDSSNLKSKYVIQDDNLLPYTSIDLKNPGEHYEDEDSNAYQIDSIVVPLYPKIYLEAVLAKELALNIIVDKELGYKFNKLFVLRFFLASSRSFKNHIANLNNMPKELKYDILSIKMPKFIWCTEFYKKESFSKGEGSGIIILDATEANSETLAALIFAGYPDKCVRLDENNFVTLQHKFVNYRCFYNLN